MHFRQCVVRRVSADLTMGGNHRFIFPEVDLGIDDQHLASPFKGRGWRSAFVVERCLFGYYSSRIRGPGSQERRISARSRRENARTTTEKGTVALRAVFDRTSARSV